jgi:hypothetical protein
VRGPWTLHRPDYFRPAPRAAQQAMLVGATLRERAPAPPLPTDEAVP